MPTRCACPGCPLPVPPGTGPNPRLYCSTAHVSRASRLRTQPHILARKASRAVAALGRECRRCGARDGRAAGLGVRWGGNRGACAACERQRFRSGACPTCGNLRVVYPGFLPVCPACPRLGSEEVVVYHGSYERVAWWPIAWCNRIAGRHEALRPLVVEVRDARAARLGAPRCARRSWQAIGQVIRTGRDTWTFKCGTCREEHVRVAKRCPTLCRPCAQRAREERLARKAARRARYAAQRGAKLCLLCGGATRLVSGRHPAGSGSRRMCTTCDASPPGRVASGRVGRVAVQVSDGKDVRTYHVAPTARLARGLAREWIGAAILVLRGTLLTRGTIYGGIRVPGTSPSSRAYLPALVAAEPSSRDEAHAALARVGGPLGRRRHALTLLTRAGLLDARARVTPFARALVTWARSAGVAL